MLHVTDRLTALVLLATGEWGGVRLVRGPLPPGYRPPAQVPPEELHVHPECFAKSPHIGATREVYLHDHAHGANWRKYECYLCRGDVYMIPD